MGWDSKYIPPWKPLLQFHKGLLPDEVGLLYLIVDVLRDWVGDEAFQQEAVGGEAYTRATAVCLRIYLLVRYLGDMFFPHLSNV